VYRFFSLTVFSVLLMSLWLLLSGMWTYPLLVFLGVVSVGFSLFLSGRLGILDRLGQPLHRLAASVFYWPWLLREIVLSNLQVAKIILSRNPQFHPGIWRMSITQQSDLGRAILANSITLTPGTVSIHVRDKEIWFYALDRSIAASLLEGDMDQRARQFAGPP
jgi:multicomponent Na+:H+ antiporter subunit E